MSSDDSCTCRRSAGERQRHGHPPDRPPCCCEERCTCPHCHRGDSRGPFSRGPRHGRDGSRGSWHGSHHSSHGHHRRDGRWAMRDETDDFHHRHGPHSARRCPSCLPEQAELSEADLLARQQRCGEARREEYARRAMLAESYGLHGHHGGGHHRFYAPTTAEMLRRQNNVSFHAAANAEYDARRRELQAELDARRDEIAALQRAREERRMEAAFAESEAARRCGRGSPHRRPRSAGHARSRSPAGRDARPCSPPAPPAEVPPPAKAQERPASPSSEDVGAATTECRPASPFHHRHHRPHSRGDRTPPPLRHHHRHGWGWEGPRSAWGCDERRPPSPRGPWQHGWGWGCPPPGAWGRHSPSPWQHTRRPPPPPHAGPMEWPRHCGGFHHDRPPAPWEQPECPPPPPQKVWDCPPSCKPNDVPTAPCEEDSRPPTPPPPPPHKEQPPHCPPAPPAAHACGEKTSPPPPPPPPPPHRRACSPHHSPHPAGDGACACPACGHAMMSARDVVSMIAAGRLGNSVACPNCGFVGGTLRCRGRHREPTPPGDGHGEGRGACHDDVGGFGKRGRPRHGQGGQAWPRSRSAASSSSNSLTSPKYGHKVFITDDVYRDRRARYLAEWEARGAVRRLPPSHRSPSAPLPERTTKWRTTASGRNSE